MKGKLLIGLIFVFFLNCSHQKNSYDTSVYISPQEQDSLIYKTLRYSAKLPPTATHETKFNSVFDPYYKSFLKTYDIRHYWISPDKTNFFFMTREARSVTPMREGIGGKLTVGDQGRITSYEEIFRTWKMADDSLKSRGEELFNAMIKGEDLTPYYSKNKGDRYIEFPDDRFFFNKNDKRWHDKELDSLQIN